MKIVRVLNNNIVLASERAASEHFIAMGKGIGFQKKSGDLIAEDRVEQYFTLADRALYLRYKTLVASIDPLSAEIGEQVISYAVKEFPDKKFNDSIHIALTDHFNGVLEREKMGLTLDNTIWSEIKRIYRDEFSIGTYAVKIMNERLGSSLGHDEAAFIAMHFVNTQTVGTSPDVERVSSLIHDIESLVKTYFDVQPDEDSVNYYRFIEHIKIISHCIFGTGEAAKEDSLGIYDFLAERYPEVTDCTCQIEQMLLEKYDHVLSSDDKSYLILYIERLIR